VQVCLTVVRRIGGRKSQPGIAPGSMFDGVQISAFAENANLRIHLRQQI
jgi:hypothetical protein